MAYCTTTKIVFLQKKKKNIVEIFTGKDGQVKMVDIQTVSVIPRHPALKMTSLDILEKSVWSIIFVENSVR